jgi:hypothetical protein
VVAKLEAWFDVEDDEPNTVTTAAELDAVLDTVSGWPGRNTVQLILAGHPERGMLDVGLDAEHGRGVLYYAGPTAPDGCCTQGPHTADETPLYYYMGSDTEFPADAEVPLGVVRRAAHEYMTTGGERPSGVQWRPWPA